MHAKLKRFLPLLLRSWAAYVAGALVVLMHEKGCRFTDGISILVSSAVPEGKGVSSSAAVEVSIMQALAAAHGVHLEGRELALLCQKVCPQPDPVVCSEHDAVHECDVVWGLIFQHQKVWPQVDPVVWKNMVSTMRCMSLTCCGVDISTSGLAAILSCCVQ